MREVLLAALLLGVPALAQEGLVTVQEAAPDSTQTGTASIEGAAVNDVTNEPVKKAQVLLMGVLQNMHQPPTAVTDASGSFAFRRLPAGTYMVQATHPSFDQNRDNILGDNQKEIVVVADQHVTGVSLRLTPNGVISGHLTDEYGDPAANCQVFAVPANRRPIPPMGRMYASTSDDHGEYRITGISAGRYSVYERCRGNLIAPHGFMERDDPRRPALVFVPEFYGGTPGTKGASSVSVQPGADVQGIDFHLKTESAVTLHIGIVSDQAFDPKKLEVAVTPEGDATDMQSFANWDERSGGWLARSLIPGVYTIHAMSREEGITGEAEANIADGVAKPVSVQLSPPITLTGSVQVEGGDKTEMLAPREIMLMPLDNSRGVPPSHGPINKNGTFTLTGVMPGRWLLQVAGFPGTIRTATLGQHEISPFSFEIGPGVGGPLNVTLTTKQVTVTVNVSGGDSGKTVWAIAVPKGSEESREMGSQNLQMGQVQGASAQLTVAPGKYTVYAIDCAQPWPVMSDEGLWSAVSDRGKALELKDDAVSGSVSVDVITRADLRYAIQRESQ